MSKLDEQTCADFVPDMRVRYVPYHAHGNKTHPDCEDGTVTSIGAVVFVKFDGKNYSEACKPDQLLRIKKNVNPDPARI